MQTCATGLRVHHLSRFQNVEQFLGVSPPGQHLGILVRAQALPSSLAHGLSSSIFARLLEYTVFKLEKFSWDYLSSCKVAAIRQPLRGRSHMELKWDLNR